MIAEEASRRWEWPLHRIPWLEVAWAGFAVANPAQATSSQGMRCSGHSQRLEDRKSTRLNSSH